MRYFLLGFLLLCVGVVAVAGFRGGMSRKPPIEVFPDMDRQLKVRPQQGSDFFADGMGSRLQVAGTIARGQTYQETPMNTGRETGSTNFVAVNPVPVTAEFLRRGRERFQISCLPCHGAAADGKGITTKFGMAVVANLQDKRIVQMADGEIFHVITNGRNLMGPYGANVDIRDRWAIVAYLRALQLSRLGSEEDVPADLRAKLK
jgi:hypothetical protein